HWVEWRHEITNRWLANGLNASLVAGRVAAAAIATLLARDAAAGHANFPLAAASAVLSALTLVVPKFLDDAKFWERQAYHDLNCRELEAIKVALRAGTIGLDEAVERYVAIIRR